jgi:hypothetical protein
MKLLRTNLLAVGFGVLIAALATSAHGLGVTCNKTLGPFYADVDNSRATIFVGTTINTGPTYPGQDIEFEVIWGDGTESWGVPTGGAYAVHLAHTYSTPLSGISITLVFFKGANESPPTHPYVLSCTTNTFDVLAAPGSPPPPPPGGDVLSNPTLQLTSARMGVPVTGVIATFSDSNPSPNVPDFTGLINWGDGTQSDGVVSSSAGTLSVSAPAGGHSYDQSDSVNVSVTLSAPGVASSTATGTVRVKERR